MRIGKNNPLRDWLFHVVLAWAIIFMIALASQANAEGINYRASHDIWGFKMPDDCRTDLSWVPSKIKTGVNLGYAADGRKTAGWWEPHNPKKPDRNDWGVIYVDKSITNPVAVRWVIHHERCHALLWVLYGNPKFHRE